MKSVFTFFSQKAAVFFAIFLLTGVIANAQLKIGTNPTTIQKTAILELEASRQGLLLPRLADTLGINALGVVPDGMMIFLTADASLRVRSGGSWKKVADAGATSSNWTITGNSGTDPLLNFIGTLDGQPLIMKTNSLPRVTILANGNVGVGTTTPTAKFNVDGDVKLQNLAAGTTELDVLVLAADGSVYKRTMSSTAFINAISAINGIQAQSLSFTAVPSDTSNAVLVQNRTVDSTIALFLPVQNGTAGALRPYGLLTYSDWQDIQSAIQVITIGAVAGASNINGATIAITDSARVITLHPADLTNPGIVTAGAQTFGGDKTFAGTVTLNNVAENSLLDSVLVISNGLVQKRFVNSSAFTGAIRSINSNTDSIQGIAFHNFGTDLSITTSAAVPGTDSIFLNVPDAGTAARGVVTTTLQTYGGVKKFADSVAAATALLVGSATNANSTLQVAGSMSMSIREVAANTTLSVSDNTILVNTSGAPGTVALIVTLPATATIAGRIYTIKKIGTGDIDNSLTITPTGAATIDGGPSYIIYNDYSFITVQTDGTNWFIIKK